MSLFGIIEKREITELNILIESLKKDVAKIKSQKEKLISTIQEKNIIIENFKKKEIQYLEKIKEMIDENQGVEVEIRSIKNNDNFLDYINILYIGLKLKTQTGRFFEIVSINDGLKIRNSKGKVYPIVKKVLENYIQKKDFDSSKGHYSYEPSIAKYIVEGLKERGVSN